MTSFNKRDTGNSTHPKGQSDGDVTAAEGHGDAVPSPQVLVNWSDVRGWAGGRARERERERGLVLCRMMCRGYSRAIDSEIIPGI